VWAVKAEPHVMIRLKRTLPRIQASRTGEITVVDTPEMARELAWFMDRFPLTVDPIARARLDKRLGEHRAREEDVAAVLQGNGGLPGLVEPARTPRDYQQVAAAMMRASRRMILGDDLGLGKTFESLLLLAQEDALPALVVTQTHLPWQWIGELGQTWPLLLGHILRGTKPYDLANIRAHRGYVPDVLVSGYSRVAGWADTLAGKIKTVILDECQELRNGVETAKGTAIAQIADQANYVVGLSATPIYNYGEEMWSILSIIAPDALGDRQEFRREWCKNVTQNGHAIVENPAALGGYLRDQGLFLRRTRAEVGRELGSEPQRIRVDVESDPKALEALKADTLALARLILDQSTEHTRRFVAMGSLDAQIRQATGIAKAPYVAAFVRLLLESTPKLVLFGWHHSVYDIWREELADANPVFYTGDETAAQKRKAVEAFIDGDARVLVMSLRSGAGLDGLQKATSVCVFGELGWSPGVHAQAIGRLQRDGQAAPVLAYFPVSDGGSDPVMDSVLQLKSAQAEPMLDPDAPVFVPTAEDAADHVRLLAEQLVARAATDAA
jgi:SNF2 family DNA or RNA helicase